ncbi:hypothetical protein GCM10027516_15070 [Niabella aquatica]
MLTIGQIQELEDLCYAEGIYFYDVRMEMTDHLAQGIEQKIAERPGLTFDEAMREAAQSLGVYGFHKIAGEKEALIAKALRKRQRILFWEYFTLPKLLGSCLLFLTLASPYLLFKTSVDLNIKINMIGSAAFITSAGLYTLFTFIRPGQQLISLPPLSRFNWLILWVSLINGTNLLRDHKNEGWFNSTWFVMVFSFMMTISILFALAWMSTYNKAYKEARKNYPLAFEK